MIAFARIQNRIYYGYTKAAIRLGTNHAIYRSSNGINPIQTANFIDNRLIGIDQDFSYKKAKKYGDMSWQFLPFDGLTLQNYDYMVGGQITYFIADIAPDDRLSPPVCVECNGIVSVFNPVNTLVAGTNPIQQFQPEGVPIITLCPCSILQNTRSENTNLKLPTSVKLPLYDVVIPDFDDVIIKPGYMAVDNIGRRMTVLKAERTKQSLGFRLVCAEQGT